MRGAPAAGKGSLAAVPREFGQAPDAPRLEHNSITLNHLTNEHIPFKCERNFGGLVEQSLYTLSLNSENVSVIARKLRAMRFWCISKH